MNGRLKELEERASKYAKNAENILLTSSTKLNYDNERDAMRFHVKWIGFCTLASIILITISFIGTYNRPIGNAYMTSIDGKVIHITPTHIVPR